MSALSSSQAPSPLVFLGPAFAFLVVMLGTTLPTPLYPIYQAEYGFSQLVITLIFAVYAIGVIGALVVAGRWSDQLGRRPLLLAGMLIAAVSDVVFWLGDSLGWLLLGRMISGASAGIFTGTATVAVIELAPNAWKPRATLAATAVNMGGLGLGPLVAGVLATWLPTPLTLPYALHFILLGVGMALVWRAPETVNRAAKLDLRVQRLHIPPEVRRVFVPAALVGFAGFAVLGFFSSMAPAFMQTVLGEQNLAVIGLVVCLVFFASTAGQSLQGRVPPAWRLPLGCLTLLAGVALIGTGIFTHLMAVFGCGALLAGTGQGLGFRAGMGAIAAASPADQRGSVTSAFFVVAYVALSIPVVGIGLATHWLGLEATGTGFAGLAALLCVVALVKVRRITRQLV
ncbi:MFS transporter [Vreelandella jeotgali]|uniref:MFS transporter n=1 Tax=Vreelandella jeotgali TaxID=553386 RepID=UPI00034BA7B5|nr:MFS transporter [Halomonas jeotgali]